MQSRLRMLTSAGVCLAVVLALQILGLPNPVTGVAVNAVFVFLIHYMGMPAALIVGLLSPVGGLISGHLPAILYPVLPAIIAGNLVFIAFYGMSKERFWLIRYFLPSAAKGGLIYWLGSAIIAWLDIADKAQWLITPILGLQFFTAFVGILIGERVSRRIV